MSASEPASRRRTPFERALGAVALALARTECIGKTRVMRAAGVLDEHAWHGAPMRSVRCRWHGGTVELNTAELYERLAWFLGRYHELPVQLLMMRCMRPGEVFVDIGANLGLLSLMGAWVVGPAGMVHAYEPNPTVFRRFERHLERNGVTNVRARPVALGDQPGEFTLTVIGDNTGSATLGDVPGELAPHIREQHRVTVVPSDDEAGSWTAQRGEQRPVFIKMDAEGAETRIVLGMERALRTIRPLIVTEVNPFALGINGSSPRALRGAFERAGYRGWNLESTRIGLRTFRPVLLPLDPLPVRQLHDEVWVHPESVHWERIQPLIRR